MTRKFILILILCFVQPAFAWNYSGHRMVAAIAYQQLTPKTRMVVNRLLVPLGIVYPHFDNFVLSATWPDFLKSHDVHSFDSWHYINFFFDAQNKTFKKPTGQNILWALSQAKHTLVSPRSNAVEKACALSFIIHFVGDIHQPLHTISRISEQFPKGDRGGNLFLLKGSYPNLHALWDAGLGQYRHTQEKKLIKTLMQKYPPASFNNISQDKPSKWALESAKISHDFIYQDIAYQQKPSPQYLEKAREVANQRLVLAGYRLAYVLETLVKKQRKIIVKQKQAVKVPKHA